MKPRICVVTAGHLSGCPRMLKAADALHEAGYRVRVVSTRYVDWCIAADEAVRRAPGRAWKWSPVSFQRPSLNWLRSGARYRTALRIVEKLGVERTPLPIVVRARARFHSELVDAICAEPTDFIYGGTGNIGPTVAAAGERLGVRFGIDLEDFHSAELDDTPSGVMGNRMSERIERAYLSRAVFLTAGSDAIRDAYIERFGVQPIAIHNTFALPEHPPTFHDDDKLGMYWFSQTIGAGRGLEEAVRAIGLANIPASLHLRGVAQPAFMERLSVLAREVAPSLKIEQHAPIAPDELVKSCRAFSVGLALEPGERENNRLALSNKALTYPLAGLAMLVTSTIGQLGLARDLGEGCVTAAPGDVAALAAGLLRWSSDRASLRRAREASWAAARDRWHWEHPAERGALLAAVREAVGA